jgi:hypothetical protein
MSYGGHEAKFYYVGEAVYGVTPTNPVMKGIENVENIEPGIDPSNLKLRGTGSRDLSAIKRGLKKVDVKIDYIVPSDDILHFMKQVDVLDPLSLEIIYDKAGTIIDLRYMGCRFDKETVQCSVEDVIKATADLIGQDMVAETAKITGATYSDWGGAVPWSESYVSRGDADGTNQVVLEEITDWKWTIENNLKRVPVIRSTNGYLLKYLQERQRNITGELTFEFENRTEYFDAVNDAEFSIKIGMSQDKYALFKYCKWDSIKTPTKIEDLVSLRAPFTARQVTLA